MGASKASDYSQQIGLRSGNIASKKKSSIEYMTDRGNKKDEIDYEAVTEKFQTDRFRSSRPTIRE